VELSYAAGVSNMYIQHVYPTCISNMYFARVRYFNLRNRRLSWSEGGHESSYAHTLRFSATFHRASATADDSFSLDRRLGGLEEVSHYC
jgi:hypothetical protein